MSETHYWVYDESFDSAEKAHELAMVVIRTRDQTIAAKDTTIAQQAVTIRTLRAALDATQKELWDTVIIQSQSCLECFAPSVGA